MPFTYVDFRKDFSYTPKMSTLSYYLLHLLNLLNRWPLYLLEVMWFLPARKVFDLARIKTLIWVYFVLWQGKGHITTTDLLSLIFKLMHSKMYSISNKEQRINNYALHVTELLPTCQQLNPVIKNCKRVHTSISTATVIPRSKGDNFPDKFLSSFPRFLYLTLNRHRTLSTLFHFLPKKK